MVRETDGIVAVFFFFNRRTHGPNVNERASGFESGFESLPSPSLAALVIKRGLSQPLRARNGWNYFPSLSLSLSRWYLQLALFNTGPGKVFSGDRRGETQLTKWLVIVSDVEAKIRLMHFIFVAAATAGT